MKNILNSNFREELVEALIFSGMSVIQAKKFVTKRYKEEIKKQTLDRLDKVLTLLKEDKFDEIESLIRFSPDGDCMGCDNHYIDFSFLSSEDNTIEDIHDVIRILKREPVIDEYLPW